MLVCGTGDAITGVLHTALVVALELSVSFLVPALVWITVIAGLYQLLCGAVYQSRFALYRLVHERILNREWTEARKPLVRDTR